MRKKSKTQDRLEAKVLYQHGGKIDFKKLWEKDSEVEADPVRIEALIART
jgi:hypothetical protein